MSKNHQFIFVTRRGKFWLKLFSLIVLLVVLGVGFAIVSKVKYVITPEVYEQSALVSVKIDLSAGEPLYTLNTIPGRLLDIGEDLAALENKGYESISSDGQIVIYLKENWLDLVENMAISNRASGQTLLGQVVATQQSGWQKKTATDAYEASFKIDQQLIKDFPIANWSRDLMGVEIKEGLDWLHSQSGVLSVKISDRWSFLANFSLKALGMPPRVLIKLDI